MTMVHAFVEVIYKWSVFLCYASSNEASPLNPLITNDAYMRQIIACAEVPMTHICVKDEGAHFHGIFGCRERATALSSSQQIQ